MASIFRSTIGLKVLMALSGIILGLYVVFHMLVLGFASVPLGVLAGIIRLGSWISIPRSLQVPLTRNGKSAVLR
jgi:hypothetical protein